MFKLLFFGLFVSFNCFLSYGQSFGLEENFPNSVSLPNSVYQTLLKKKDINETIKEERDSGKSIKSVKARFFDVTKININDDNLPDLLVKAKSFLSGMNTTRYWVFKKSSKGYVLLFEVATSSLTLLKNRSKGYRIIKSAYLSGSKVYFDYFRFDGRKYVHSWSREEDI